MNSIDVRPLLSEEEPVLAALLQLYRYDFSEFTNDDVAADGRYATVTDRFQSYVSDATYSPYLVRVDGQLAGFAILRRCDAVDGRGPVTDIAQFFVMRKYRRQRIGEEVATRMFDLFAGVWQVSERPTNLPAQAFWRAIIGRYTGDEFEEIPGDGDRGPVQFFVSNAGRASKD